MYDVLQEGSICGERWQDVGLTIETDRAYMCYVEFSKRQRDWKPEISLSGQRIFRPPSVHTLVLRGQKGRHAGSFFPVRITCRLPTSVCRPPVRPRFGMGGGERARASSKSARTYGTTTTPASTAKWEPETDPEPEYETEDGPLD